jgi:hypothetical protein
MKIERDIEGMCGAGIANIQYRSKHKAALHVLARKCPWYIQEQRLALQCHVHGTWPLARLNSLGKGLGV